MIKARHNPVMVQEVLDLLITAEDGVYVDGTLGGGGHARAILERLGPDGRLVGLDRDRDALAEAGRRLADRRSRCELVQGNFAGIRDVCGRLNIRSVDGVLLDLGISSAQLDEASRGFSFMRDGPLDMRFDRAQQLTAADLIRTLSAEDLADIIRSFGEERSAGRIARAIVRERAKREVVTTGQLADIICRAAGGRRTSIHPATRSFQALRIAVNRELEHLEEGLENGIALLKRGGRMAVISYHSLEDRIVKRIFLRHVGGFESLPQGGRRWNGSPPAAVLVNRKPLNASDVEVAENPRARSAKLRVIERID